MVLFCWFVLKKVILKPFDGLIPSISRFIDSFFAYLSLILLCRCPDLHSWKEWKLSDSTCSPSNKTPSVTPSSSSSPSDKSISPFIGAGDLVVAPLTGYIDLLIMIYLFAPKFAITSTIPLDYRIEDDLKVRAEGSLSLRSSSVLLLGSMACVCDAIPSEKESSLNSLLKIATLAGRPLFIFPEGTSSNGSSLLKPSHISFFSSSPPPIFKRIYLFGIKYVSNPPSYPIHTGYLSLLIDVFWRICDSGSKKSQLRYMNLYDENSKDVSFIDSSCSSSSFIEDSFMLLSSILQLKIVSFTLFDKRRFLKAFVNGKNK